MKKCKYDLGHAEFYTVNVFLLTLAVDGDMTIDEYEGELKKIRGVGKEEFLGLESIRKIGKTMFEAQENMELHIKICEECRKNYKDFLELQKNEDRKTVEILKSAGFKNLDEDSVDPDFLGLYSQ